MYSLHYIIEFVSEKSNDIRIEILEKDFTGIAVRKRLGGAPVLSIAESDIVMGGTLTMPIEAAEDGDLRSLYTTDNKKFRVIVYKNAAAIWQGYILPELYSESYIAAPYDVSVTASDGLGILKNEPYPAEDRRSLLIDIIKQCLSITGLELDIEIFCNIQIDGQDNALPFFSQNRVNELTFSGKNCYETIESIIGTLNAVIFQKNNRWIIARHNDLRGQSYILSWSDLSLSRRRDFVRATVGKLHREEIAPLGNLDMTILPAIKSIEVISERNVRQSILKNSDCTSDDAWTTAGDVDVPRLIENESEGNRKIDYFTLHPLTREGALPGRIYQHIDVIADPDSVFSIVIRSRFEAPYDANFDVNIRNLATVGYNYHLTLDGWVSDEDGSPLDGIPIKSEVPDAGYESLPDKATFVDTKIVFSGIPRDGVLRVEISGYKRWIKGLEIGQVDSPAHRSYRLYIGGFYIKNENVIPNIKSLVIAAPKASTPAPAMSLYYGYAQRLSNIEKLVNSYLSNKDDRPIFDAPISVNGGTFPDLLRLIAYDRGQDEATAKYMLDGSLMGATVEEIDVYRDVFSGKDFYPTKIDYDLFSDDVSVTLREIPPYDSEITEGDLEQSGGSSGNSSSSGGDSSTPGSRVAVLTDWEKYSTEKDGYALGAGLGYGLKMQFENTFAVEFGEDGKAVHVQTPADFVAKNISATGEFSATVANTGPGLSIPWTDVTNQPLINGRTLLPGNNTLEYLGIDISAGLDPEQMWAELAKPSANVIDASHIPALPYLPITGGTLTGSLNMQNNPVIWEASYSEDWNESTGLKVLSSFVIETSHAPVKYAVGLNVGFLPADYKFQIAAAGSGGGHLYFRDRNINNGVWSPWYTVYHNGNLTKLSQLTDDVVSGKYLPLSGGILSADLRNLLILKDTNTSTVYQRGAYITFYAGSSEASYSLVGRNTGVGSFLENYVNGASYLLNITNAGELMFRNNSVYHSGNANLATVDWKARNIFAYGELAAASASDIRLKENIQPITHATATKVLRVLSECSVEFDWNADALQLNPHKNGHSASFIAQEMEKVLPFAISPIFNKYLGIDKTAVLPYVVVGFSKHDREIHRLKKKIAALENQIKRLGGICDGY